LRRGSQPKRLRTREKKTVVKAADAKELKKKNAEAHGLYKKYLGQSKAEANARPRNAQDM